MSLSCGSSIKNENHQKEKERKRSNTRRGVVKGKQKGYLFKEPHKKETLQSSKSRSTQTKRIASCPAKMTICLTPKNQSRKHSQPEKQLWCWKIASLVSEHRGHVKAEKLEIRVDLEKLKVIQELSDIGVTVRKIVQHIQKRYSCKVTSAQIKQVISRHRAFTDGEEGELRNGSVKMM